DLSFGPISFAGYNNYVYRDAITSAQIVITNNASTSSPSRFITAFPQGNTGALVYFIPQNGTLSTTLNFTSVTSVNDTYGQVGLTGDLDVSSDLAFGVTLIGGVRTLRDYVESGGTVFHTIFNYTLGPYNSSSVTLIRPWINGTTVQYLSFASSNGNFSVSPSTNVTLPPNITYSRNDKSGNGTLTFTSTFNFTDTTPSSPVVDLVGLGREALFITTPPANGTTPLTQVISAIQNNGSAIADQLSFLSYSAKSLAGGWRFLTYLSNNLTASGNLPSYSYVMLDTDFLLLPVLSSYFLSTPQGLNRSTAFLAQNSTLKNGTFSQLLLQNVDHVLNLSMPFALSATKENLVPIRDANVGDWRDSNTGLGGGKYPFDVNVALIPAALRAIASLSAAGILPADYQSNATQYAGVWESQASTFFQVSISPQAASASLNNYVVKANLSESLLYGAGVLNSTTANMTGLGGTTGLGDYIGAGVNGTNSTFYALSLTENGIAVEVLHSDLGFVMLYGNNVPQGIMQAVVEALQPYPRGLLTNVGMVVANAAYDTNTTNIYTFNNLMYHGAVSWSWQQGLMASGLSRQLGLCGLSNETQSQAPSSMDTIPSWCSDSTLTSSLLSAQTRLWDSIVGSAPDLYTEVLSPVFNSANNTFTIGDLGAISPEGTEGDAIQLWSYGFLAQVDPRSGRAVAGGFP
ncbi:hypothetical protein P7C73_g1082, partial [Tremellales sp. Uapishka_1]